MVRLLVFATALALRLAYLASRWAILPDWNIDAAGYHQLAVNLLQRGIFSLDAASPFQPDAIRTPAYPLMVALIYAVAGIAPRAVLVAQAVLDALTAVIVLELAGSLSSGDRAGPAKPTDHPRAAVIAGVLYAAYPTAWRYCAELYTETALSFAIALAFWLLSRPSSRHGMWRGVWVGAACGLAILLKPNALPLAGILGLALVADLEDPKGGAIQTKPAGALQAPPLGSVRQRAAVLAAFGAVLIALLAPWVARNALVFGRPMLSSAFDNNLARVSAPATLAAAWGETVAPWTPRWEEIYNGVVQRAIDRNPALFAVPAADMTPRQLDQVQVEIAGVSRDILAQYPWAFVRSHLAGAFNGWLPLDHQFWYAQLTGQRWESAVRHEMTTLLARGQWDGAPPLAWALYLAFAGLYAAGFVLCLMGAWRAGRTFPAVVLAMLACIVALTVLPGPIAYERFRLPVMPLVCALIGCAFLARPKPSSPGRIADSPANPGLNRQGAKNAVSRCPPPRRWRTSPWPSLRAWRLGGESGTPPVLRQ